MSLSFRTSLYRERRRLALVTTLAFVAGVLFYWPSKVYLAGLHISVITGTVYAGVVGVAALLICIIFPRLRFMMEAVAISRLILAFAILAMPELGPAVLTNPLLMALIVVSGGACISRLLHGRILRHPLPRFSFGPTTRKSVVAVGTDWQRSFVSWVDGAAPVPVRVAA